MIADLRVHAAEVAAAVSYYSVAVAVAVAGAVAATEPFLTTRQMKYLRNGKIIKLM